MQIGALFDSSRAPHLQMIQIRLGDFDLDCCQRFAHLNLQPQPQPTLALKPKLKAANTKRPAPKLTFKPDSGFVWYCVSEKAAHYLHSNASHARQITLIHSLRKHKMHSTIHKPNHKTQNEKPTNFASEYCDR